MKTRFVCASVILTCSFACMVSVVEAREAKRLNVLFLAVDDMKDWVNCLGGYEGTVHTPNIDRLAKRGMLFTNAHCPSPKCAPSRAAIMTGLRPSTTGLYEFKRGNAAVRSDRYRYIRYRDGGEELYDHQTDPHEWNNLAASEDHAAIKKKLAGWIAKEWAESAPTKGAFRFDHETFRWTHKKTGKTTVGK
jgi:arylsulfatase A-like enzyme